MIPIMIVTIENSDDRDFMEEVYLSYKRLMFSEIVKITNDRWAAEDVLQSVVVKLIDKLPLLQTLSKPKLINYIISASRNTAFNHLRSLKRAAEVSYDDEFDNMRNQAPSIDEGLMLSEMLDNIGSAWEKLDERSRRILEMKYVLEKANEDIAKELEIKPSSVRMLLTRARNALKAQIEKAEMT